MRTFRLLLFYAFALLLAYLMLLLVFALGEPGWPVFMRGAALLGMTCIFVVYEIILGPGIRWGRWGYVLLALTLFMAACVNYVPGALPRESFFYGAGYVFAERVPRAIYFMSFVPAMYFFYAGIRREESSEPLEMLVKLGVALAGTGIAACAVTFFAAGTIIPVALLLMLSLYVLLTHYDRNIMRIALVLGLGCLLYACTGELLLALDGRAQWLIRLLAQYREACFLPLLACKQGSVCLWQAAMATIQSAGQ